MVRIEKVVIQGFKSFKRRVTLTFPKNFVVITGPNGSGKSNIPDAICFALGESSGKILRFNNIKELVFQGSEKKKGSEYGVVSVYFSNDDGKLPTSEREVVISRRINPAGVSTFRINGLVKTRSEVLDFLSRARIFPGGHNVIMQGEVQKFAEMDEKERREIIDRVAGIAEYEEKKSKAMKQLERVEEKVKEAEIILSEKEEWIRRLKSDRDAAIKFKKLSEEKAVLESAILWREYTREEEKRSLFEARINEKEKELEIVDRKIEMLEKEKKKREDEFSKLAESMSSMGDALKIFEEIKGVESEIRLKERMMEENKREVRRIETLVEELSKGERKREERFSEVLNLKGVHGFLHSIINVDERYTLPVRVAAANHYNDIVVDNMEVAVRCVKILKEKKIGTARFLPLAELEVRAKEELPPDCIAWVSDLVKCEPRFRKAVEFVFGRTACCRSIDDAKHVFSRRRLRIVTLDGDLIERSGVLFGGYRSKGMSEEIKKRLKEMENLKKENIALIEEIEDMKARLGELRKKYRRVESVNMKARIQALKSSIERINEEMKNLLERRERLFREINEYRIKKTRVEAKREDVKSMWERVKEKIDKSMLERFKSMSLPAMKKRVGEIENELASIGPVNLKSISDFEKMMAEFEVMKEKVERIIEEKRSIERSINEIEKEKRNVFMSVFNEIRDMFKRIYKEITGGEADMRLEEPNDITSGLIILARPKGKKMLPLKAFSGGEKAIISLSFLFAVQQLRPSPFYILDEVDDPLDHVNSKKFSELIKKYSKNSQFIVVTHKDEVAKASDIVYGVTMEHGESKVLSVSLEKEGEK